MNQPLNSAASSITPFDKQLSVRVLHSFAEAESLRVAWNDLVTRSGVDIYQTFEWCSTWWKYYGEERKLHLLLGFSGEELVALIPAFIETLWLGPVWIRAAKLIGSDFSLSLCNLPAIPSMLPAMIDHGIEYFVGKNRCDILLIGPLSGLSAEIEAIITAGHKRADLIGQTQSLGTSCNTYFSLPGTFSEYLKTLDKKQRSNFKRMTEQSAKTHRVTFDTVNTAERMTAEFKDFCRQHEDQWRLEGKLGHFGDWPHAYDFNRDLINTLSAQGMVRFYRILADDQVISSQYCFILGRSVYWRLPARIRSAEWDRCSLGTMGLVRMIELSISQGAQTIEAGRGHYGYKVLHGAREWPLRTVQYIGRGSFVSTRVRLFRAFAALLNLLYYKIFFVRIGPRLPMFQRALWSVWIRSTW